MRNHYQTNLNPRTYPAICQAVISGRLSRVQRALDAGENVNRITRAYLDYTPLHWAVMTKKRIPIMQLLLDRGADTEQMSADGLHALNMAVDRNHVKAVEMLLDHGADVDATCDGTGFEPPWTPLRAAIGRLVDTEIVQILLQHGASTTWHVMDPAVPVRQRYISRIPIGVCEYISRVLSHAPMRRDELLEIIRNERPDEFMEWWAGTGVQP